jgi:hypothetical protein
MEPPRARIRARDGGGGGGDNGHTIVITATTQTTDFMTADSLQTNVC